jgi:GH25 family lysozyme M1 (1,4-beta-N-acetylmuramidase)
MKLAKYPLMRRPGDETPATRQSRSETFRNIALGIAGIVSAIGIPVLGYYYTDKQKNKELEKGFVELGIKILSDSPSARNKPLREWAIDIINNYSEVRLPKNARQVLLEQLPIFQSSGSGFGVPKQMLNDLSKQGFTLGVAVSHFNHNVDFSALKSRNIQFVYIKVSTGDVSRDEAALRLAAGAEEQGFKIGPYHLVTGRDGHKEAENFNAAMGGTAWDLPPLIDCEKYSGAMPDAKTYADAVFALASDIEKARNVKPVIYTGSSFSQSYLDERFASFPLAVASYSRPTDPRSLPLPKWWKDYAFWDFTESVVDDPALKNIEVFAFKGDPAALAALGRNAR